MLPASEAISRVLPRLMAQAGHLCGPESHEEPADLVHEALARWLAVGAPYSGSQRLQAYLSVTMRNLRTSRDRRRWPDPLDADPCGLDVLPR